MGWSPPEGSTSQCKSAAGFTCCCTATGDRLDWILGRSLLADTKHGTFFAHYGQSLAVAGRPVSQGVPQFTVGSTATTGHKYTRHMANVVEIINSMLNLLVLLTSRNVLLCIVRRLFETGHLDHLNSNGVLLSMADPRLMLCLELQPVLNWYLGADWQKCFRMACGEKRYVLLKTARCQAGALTARTALLYRQPTMA